MLKYVNTACSTQSQSKGNTEIQFQYNRKLFVLHIRITASQVEYPQKLLPENQTRIYMCI